MKEPQPDFDLDILASDDTAAINAKEGLPASGYLMGTYENLSNAGDGFSMAYHAGAELTNID